jgi:hypothetical protein
MARPRTPLEIIGITMAIGLSLFVMFIFFLVYRSGSEERNRRTLEHEQQEQEVKRREEAAPGLIRDAKRREDQEFRISRYIAGVTREVTSKESNNKLFSKQGDTSKARLLNLNPPCSVIEVLGKPDETTEDAKQSTAQYFYDISHDRRASFECSTRGTRKLKSISFGEERITNTCWSINSGCRTLFDGVV